MANLTVGEVQITGLVDGEFVTGPEYFGPAATFRGHEDLVAPDGKMHLPIGCFLMQGGRLGGRTVLVDAGLGEMSGDTFRGGELLKELAKAGSSPSTVDDIVISHLHMDHCGWLVDAEAQPVFAKARIWVGAADWDRFVEAGADVMLESVREGLKTLAHAGRVTTIDGDGTVTPGLDALAAPGHTPGHLTFVVSDGAERALLLGDAISCPVQLDETDWGALSDVDPDLARRTRQRLWDEMEQAGLPAVGAHFPGLQFGRVLPGAGRRYWS